MKNLRYITEKIHSKSLEGNPLNSPADRQFMIYLPPGYHEPVEKRYPVIYLLHGYCEEIDDLLVGTKKYLKKSYPLFYRLLLWKSFKKRPKYEDFDTMIINQEIQPFILVQPDCSLKIPDIYGRKKGNGLPFMKGSFYLNSPYTGNYSDYIFDELINFVDIKYRTIPNKEHRALMGASMGGYGTLYGCLKYPEKFNVGVALSPVLSFLDILEIKFIMPLYIRIYGKKKAEKLSSKDLGEIMDTFDLIFCNDNRLIPSIKRNSNGSIIEMNEFSKKKWMENDIIEMVKNAPNPFQNIKLLVNSEIADEFGLSTQIKTFQQVLSEIGIEQGVDIDIYYDKSSEKISPHEVGILSHLFPGILYCLKNIT
ncbi:alpha/beta hydrolase-fold protein [Promethearchaeum syntrophicum]|uniref:Alpha/beta hydrolase-fold protein n=1 Tax=Promethearchaeum syntrophicum TaxID=2594042 RepID=A0A5B9DEY1_9ARCH|nr:alpha/beta hydrolase-fold protein [Candidatus Prometheoarchaeum syntrophicum]